MPKGKPTRLAAVIAEACEGKITQETAFKMIVNILRKDGCSCCDVMEKAYMKMVDERDHAIEMCADVAEKWEPPLPPSLNSLRLQSEVDQLDAKIRPIQLAAGKAIAKAIRERAT